MVSTIKEILLKEYDALLLILNLLDNQYKKILKKDVFGLEAVVEDIKLGNREVAKWEVERRKILGQKNLNDLIYESKDEELDKSFRNIKKILEEIKVQKETNEILIKQNLSYTNRLLSIINPKKDTNLYNSYGVIKR